MTDGFGEVLEDQDRENIFKSFGFVELPIYHTWNKDETYETNCININHIESMAPKFASDNPRTQTTLLIMRSGKEHVVRGTIADIKRIIAETMLKTQRMVLTE